MLNKLLRKLENSGWTTAALGDGWDDEEDVQQSPAATAPAPAPAAAPVAPAPLVKQPVPQGQMQQVSRPQQPVQTPYAAPPSEDGPDIVAIQKWVRQNYDTPAPLPSEWASGGKALLTQLGKSVHVISREMKREPQNPTLAQVKKLVPENAVAEYDPNARILKAEPETPEQTQIRKQRQQLSSEFFFSFSKRFPDFIKEMNRFAKNSANSILHDSGDLARDIEMDVFYPPENLNMPDRRVEILAKPSIRQELRKYQPFSIRFDQWLAENKIQESDLDGKTATPKQGLKDPMIPKLAELYERRPANQPNSIPDALNAITQDGMSPELRDFWMHQASKIAKGKAGEAKGRGISLDAPAGENKTIGDFQAGSGSGIGGTKRDLVEFDPEEQEEYFDALRQKIMPMMQNVSVFNDQMANALYKDCCEMAEKQSEIPTMSFTDPNGKQMVFTVADIFSIFSDASVKSITSLLNPKNVSGREEAFKVIMNEQSKNKNQDEEDDEDATPQIGSAVGQFSNMSHGKVTLNLSGENLSDIGFSTRNLVSNRAMIPYLYQIGLLKEAIYSFYANTTQNYKEIARLTTEHFNNNIKPKVMAEYAKNPEAYAADPNIELSVPVTDAFVYQAILHASLGNKSAKQPAKIEGFDPTKAAEIVNNMKLFMEAGSGRKRASKLKSSIVYQWPKVMNALQGVTKENETDPKTVALWGSLIGVHRRMVEPVNSNDIERLNAISPEMLGGKDWRDSDQKSIMHAIFPQFKNMNQEEFKAYDKAAKSYAAILKKNKKSLSKMMPDQVEATMPQIKQDAMDIALSNSEYREILKPELIELMTEYNKLDQRWSGMTTGDSTAALWKMLHPGQDLDPAVRDYVDWRKKFKTPRSSTVSRKPKKSPKARMAMEYLLRRLYARGNSYAEKITKLAKVRYSLSKVGKTPRLDSLISSAQKSAIAELHSILDLLE